MAFYFSTKKLGPISTGHRQWRDTKHCSYVHGYGRYVQFVFGCKSLDDRQWVVDFGDLKDVKKWLEDQWDHRLLIASDDPLLPNFEELHELGGCNLNVMDVTQGWGPGIEGSCKFVYDHVNPMVLQKSNYRCWVAKIEIWEHDLNSAIFIPDDEEFNKARIL